MKILHICTFKFLCNHINHRLVVTVVYSTIFLTFKVLEPCHLLTGSAFIYNSISSLSLYCSITSLSHVINNLKNIENWYYVNGLEPGLNSTISPRGMVGRQSLWFSLDFCTVWLGFLRTLSDNHGSLAVCLCQARIRDTEQDAEMRGWNETSLVMTAFRILQHAISVVSEYQSDWLELL